MNNVDVFDVEAINVKIRERLTADGEPYQVFKVTFVSKKFGSIVVSAFGKSDETVTITYGDE